MSKKLLLVDDEKFFLEGLKDGLSEYDDVFTTDICFSVNEAIKLNKKNEYDLIVTDIRMPKKSGLELFEYLRENQFKGGILAMTAYGSDEVFEKIKRLGGLDIILKPFDFTWFKDRLLEILSGEEEGVSGTIDSINLTSILQMINLEKRSVVVRIEMENSEGFLYFQNGEMVHADYEGLVGEEAALHLIKKNRGRFSLLINRDKTAQTIDTPFLALMINIMKTIDEDKKQENKKNINKEKKMNVKKLNQSIAVLKEDLAAGLLATDIYTSADGQSVVGWNSNPQACALFNKITGDMKKALEGASFPTLGRYYIIDLVDDKMVVVIFMGDYQWGMLVDRNNVQLGLLLNVVIPKIIGLFEEAMKG